MADHGRLRNWAARRWDERTHVEVVRSIDIAGSPDDVWTLVWAPEYMPLLDDDVVEAYTVPGTPRGEVGERQCSVRLSAGERVETVSEVIDCEPGRRAVWVDVPFRGLTAAVSVLPLEGHAHLVVGFRLDADYHLAQLSPGWQKPVIQEVEGTLDRYLPRVRDLIEGGWHPERDQGQP